MCSAMTSGEDAGQEVRIELQSFTDKYSGVVNTVYCGDKSDIWAYMFHCYFMVTLIACAMLFAGLVVLIISLVLDIIYKTRFDLEYLGWCMLLGSSVDAGRIEAAPAVCFQCFYSVEYVLLRCDALPGSDHVLY